MRPIGRFVLPGQPAVNVVAIYLSGVAAITLALTADAGRRARILGYVTVLILLVLGLLTESRTFLVSTALVLGIHCVMVRRQKPLLKEMLIVAGLVGAILAATFFAFGGSLARLFERQPLGFFDGRLQTWADGLELFRRYPMCGIGPGTFYDTTLNPLYAERINLGIDFITFYHAHNIFLNILAGGGVILGILLLILISAAIYGCYVILKADPQDRFGRIALALLAIMLVVGLFENTLLRPVIFPLAIFLGLGMNVTWREFGRVQEPGSILSATATRRQSSLSG